MQLPIDLVADFVATCKQADDEAMALLAECRRNIYIPLPPSLHDQAAAAVGIFRAMPNLIRRVHRESESMM